MEDKITESLLHTSVVSTSVHGEVLEALIWLEARSNADSITIITIKKAEHRLKFSGDNKEKCKTKESDRLLSSWYAEA